MYNGFELMHDPVNEMTHTRDCTVNNIMCRPI